MGNIAFRYKVPVPFPASFRMLDNVLTLQTSQFENCPRGSWLVVTL